MLYWCHVTHVLWVFRTHNSMVTLFSEFGPRKGQCQVKLGQIRSNFLNQFFLIKACPPVQFFFVSIQSEMKSLALLIILSKNK